jgi:hypothetical protein
MEYAAIILALIGFFTGVLFRLKILLAVLALVLVVSIAVSLNSGFSFVGTALTIMAAQTITQGSYFLGSVVRAVFAANNARHIL